MFNVFHWIKKHLISLWAVISIVFALIVHFAFSVKAPFDWLIANPAYAALILLGLVWFIRRREGAAISSSTAGTAVHRPAERRMRHGTSLNLGEAGGRSSRSASPRVSPPTAKGSRRKPTGWTLSVVNRRSAIWAAWEPVR